MRVGWSTIDGEASLGSAKKKKTDKVTKSRITIRNRFGPNRARPTARIRVFYAPNVQCEESLYEVLGIAETGSTVSDIKKAYKKMARKYHPDVSPPDRVDEHTRRFIMVKEAYETLSNPQTRALYDRDLAKGLGFGFSARRPYQYDQGKEASGKWNMRWQSQLEELKRRNKNPSTGRMSWGARMRAQR
ncbi:hypothetical protein DH2020_000563 [Rehmannia glutinosa]|uniref:J domain-containing protein n=1 Tax=Rehmannia glutinosa TaxID=99300 RepID=A0ABR0XWZ3_REHGL